MSWRSIVSNAQKENAKKWKNFDADNITKEQLRYLREDVHGGYKTTTNRAGKDVTSYSYYENHPGWSEIQSKLKIGQLNKQQEIARMYDYTSGYGYTPSGGGGGGSPSPAPSSQGSSSVDFSNQLAAIKAQNAQAISDLTNQLSSQKADYDAREAAANKKISSLSSTVANAQSQYNPTKDMGSSNNINPALSIQEKTKSLSNGTQRYNRNSLSINNLNV